jgi:glyoxylase I family protein
MFTYHHTAISITDIDKSVGFYSQLGFQKVLMWQSENKDLTIVHLKLGDFFLELFCYSNFKNTTVDSDLNKDLKQVGVRHFALQVNSIENGKKFMEDNGIATNIQIKEGRTGIKYFFITDPDNIFIEIVEDKRNL